MTLYTLIAILASTLISSAVFLISAVVFIPFDATLTILELSSIGLVGLIWLVSFLGILAINFFGNSISRKFNIPVA